MTRLTMLITILAVADRGVACHAADATAGLRPTHEYQPLGQPALLEATATSGVEVVDLVLMDARGATIALPRSVRVGVFDLAEVMPGAIETVRDRQQAAWLQMLVDDEPVGSPLVLEPLLTRLVPITQSAAHPVSGQLHRRITGWQVGADGPPVGNEKRAVPDPDAAEEDQDTEETKASRIRTSTPPPAPPPVAPPVGAVHVVDDRRVFTGLRVYVDHDVEMETTLGNLRIALRPDQAANTAWTFRMLSGGGFYRGVIFHRVVPQTRAGEPFVIQAGDPSATGDGGPGFWLPMEPSGLQHDFGVISMARADDPDSAGSQFFVCLSRAGTARLDGQYCAFGEVVFGASTMRAIADVELVDVARGRPAVPPQIIQAKLVPAPSRTPGVGRPDRRITPVSIHKEVTPQRVPR